MSRGEGCDDVSTAKVSKQMTKQFGFGETDAVMAGILDRSVNTEPVRGGAAGELLRLCHELCILRSMTMLSRKCQVSLMLFMLSCRPVVLQYNSKENALEQFPTHLRKVLLPHDRLVSPTEQLMNLLMTMCRA